MKLALPVCAPKGRIAHLITAAGAAMVLGASANAAVIATDDFSYPDGPLVGNGGWVNQSGTAGTLLVSGGEVVVTQDGGSEDGELVLGGTEYNSGVITAAFDIRVTAPAAMTGTDYEYFAHFSDDTNFNFRSRLDVVGPVAGGDYTLGISSGTSTHEATLPTDFNFGDTVAVSIAFDLDTGIGSVTAGGNTAFGSVLGAGDILDSFNLRQSSSSSDETIFFDNLVVDWVPAPGSVAVLGLGGLAGLRRRR